MRVYTSNHRIGATVGISKLIDYLVHPLRCKACKAIPDILGLNTKLTVVAGDGFNLLWFKHGIGHRRVAVATGDVAIEAKLADCADDVRALDNLGVALRQNAFEAIKDVLHIDGRCPANLLVHLLGYLANLAVHLLRVVVRSHDLLDMLLVPEVERSHCPGVQRHDLHALRSQRQQGLVHLLLDEVVATELRNLAASVTHEPLALSLRYLAAGHGFIDGLLEEGQLLVLVQSPVNLLTQTVLCNPAPLLCFFCGVREVDNSLVKLKEVGGGGVVELLGLALFVYPLVASDVPFKFNGVGNLNSISSFRCLFGGRECYVAQAVPHII